MQASCHAIVTDTSTKASENYLYGATRRTIYVALLTEHPRSYDVQGKADKGSSGTCRNSSAIWAWPGRCRLLTLQATCYHTIRQSRPVHNRAGQGSQTIMGRFSAAQIQSQSAGQKGAEPAKAPAMNLSIPPMPGPPMAFLSTVLYKL